MPLRHQSDFYTLMIDVYWLHQMHFVYDCVCGWRSLCLVIEIIRLPSLSLSQHRHLCHTPSPPSPLSQHRHLFSSLCIVSTLILIPYNLQGGTRGACSAWPGCRGSGRFMWAAYWTVSSRTGICSTSRPATACMSRAPQWKLPSWTPTTTVPSATRSGDKKDMEMGKEEWNVKQKIEQTVL